MKILLGQEVLCVQNNRWSKKTWVPNFLCPKLNLIKKFVTGITQLSQFQAQVFVKNLTEISVDFEIGQICEGQMLPGQKCLFVTCL